MICCPTAVPCKSDVEPLTWKTVEKIPVYDCNMIDRKVYYSTYAATGHYFPGHAECPDRVLSIEGYLKPELIEQSLNELQIAKVENESLTAVHAAGYLDKLFEEVANAAGPKAIRDHDDADGPTYVTPTTWEDSVMAASSACTLARKITETNGVGISFARPPGHHATAYEAMGFCFVNNIAVAAKYCQNELGLNKIAIIDIDVHHGNGTQDIFYRDSSVLFIDLHRDDTWPGSGQRDEQGEEEGKGFTINIPLPFYSSHIAALRTWDRIVAPAVRKFEPEMILISAGYDAHHKDPLEKLNYLSCTYHHLANRSVALAQQVCDGRCLWVLEGGYHLEAVGESSAETVRGLLGKPGQTGLEMQLKEAEPLEQVERVLDEVEKLHGLALNSHH